MRTTPRPKPTDPTASTTASTPAGPAASARRPHAAALRLTYRLLGYTLLATTCAYLTPAYYPHAIRWVAGITVAVVAAGSQVVRRTLEPRLGAPTAWAALVVVWFIVIASVSIALPDCGTSYTQHRCSAREATDWGTLAVYIVALELLLMSVPVVVRGTYRTLAPLVRANVAWIRRAPSATPTDRLAKRPSGRPTAGKNSSRKQVR